MHAWELEPGFSLWFQRGRQPVLDEGGAKLLEEIRRTGSITTAARNLRLSYKYVWNYLTRLEKVLKQPVVETLIGGMGGGGARLTVLGENLLQDYSILRERIQRFFEEELARPADLVVMGSHCLGLEVLIRMVKGSHAGLSIKVVNTGSLRGVEAVARGWADVAGTHLYDESSRQYNIPFLLKPGIAERVVLVRGYRRIQGFITAKANRKKVRSFEDLLRRDVTLINRNVGSGTRVLLDSYLKKLALEQGKRFEELVAGIRGYRNEARSHLEVALAVHEHKADVGLGIQSAARRHGLSFVPVAEEIFDFAIHIGSLAKPAIQAFLEALRSPSFMESLVKNGLKPLKETGRVIYLPREPAG